jgi:nicotinamide mononucleotide transporter
MVLDWLTSPAFTLFGAPTTWAELIGFATGLLGVWLLVRQHIANWPLGIVSVLMFVVVFWSVQLYADGALQFLYVALGLYGWWTWARGDRERAADLPVRRTGRTEWVVLAVAGVVLTVGIAVYLDRLTDSSTAIPDALTTALSLVATYGQTRKLVESWWFWITADLVYIPLYGYKQLWLTAILYVVFLTLCVFGLRAWRADLRVRTA